MGMREMLERLRERRREELENRDLGGVYDDIAEKLDQILDQEREGIERRLQEARDSGDQRRREIVEDLAAERDQISIYLTDGFFRGLQRVSSL